MSKTGVSGKGGVTLQLNQMPSRRRRRPVEHPDPDGNRRERRAYDAMRREAERTNRTNDALKLILSGEATYAYKDKQ
jgi:hypothetical protein